MFPGRINPAQMKGLMKQFGIKSQELNAEKVIVELDNGEKLVFKKPSAMLIDMKGQKTLTITGEFNKEDKEEEIKEEDIKMVVEQTKASEEKARKALEESNGDIAEAIIKLKKEQEE